MKTFSSVGLIEGTPSKAGSYIITVRVVDSTESSSGIDTRSVSIQILSANSSAPTVPVINKVKVKKKKFYVYGDNFNQSSIIIINGIIYAPREFSKEELFYKGKRPLGPTGTNQLIIQNTDSRSTVFVF